MVAPKLQKLLASLGYCSRRQAEQWIIAGRLRVNQKIAELGCRISAQDEVELEGSPIDTKPFFENKKIRVLLYHKPLGEECSKKPQQGHKSVFDRFPEHPDGRWILVGRLDVNTSGLLLITDSGELAARLMHPSYQISREYLARINGVVDEATKARMLEGVDIGGETGVFDAIRREKNREGVNQWYRVRLHTGRNREVRRIFQACGFDVSRLMRIRFDTINLPRTLHPGHYLEMNMESITDLMRAVELTF